MLGFLRGKASDRKLRLFACGCCRRNWEQLGETSHQVVELAERYADGKALAAELEAARQGIRAHHQFASGAVAWPPGPNPVPFARYAALWANGHRRRSVSWKAGRAVQAALLRDILGNPFRPVAIDPAWLRPTVVQLAQVLYDSRNFADLPILADALEESGCTSQELLDHLRGPGPHALGCWVLDLVLGKS
jgi:hypothetical protein